MRQLILAIMFFICLPEHPVMADLINPPPDTIWVDATATMAKIVRLEYVGNHALVSTRHPESGVTTLTVDRKTAEKYHLGEWIPFVRDSTDVLIRDGYANLVEMRKDPAPILARSENSEVSLYRNTEKTFISLAVKDNKLRGVALAMIKKKDTNTFLITVRSGGLVQGPANLDLVKKIVAESFNVATTKNDEEKLKHLAQSLIDEMRNEAKPTPVGNVHNTNHLGAQNSRRP